MSKDTSKNNIRKPSDKIIQKNTICVPTLQKEFAHEATRLSIWKPDKNKGLVNFANLSRKSVPTFSKLEREIDQENINRFIKNESDNQRVKDCKRTPFTNQVNLVQRDESLRYTGLATCGNIWICNCCSKIIRAKKAAMISEILMNKKAYEFDMITLTIKHKKEDKLIDLINQVNKGFNQLNTTKRIKKLYEKLGYLGIIKALDITYNDSNGWHPHLHIILVSKSGINYRTAEHAIIYEEWNKINKSELSPKAFEAVRIQKKDIEKVGKYMTKEETDGFNFMSLSLEFTQNQTKGENNIWSLARDGKEELVKEFEKATKGKTAISISRALKINDLTNEDLVKEEEEIKTEDSIKAKLSARLYRAVYNKKLNILLKQAYRENKEEGIKNLLKKRFKLNIRGEIIDLRR